MRTSRLLAFPALLIAGAAALGQTTTRVSVASDGTEALTGNSTRASISGAGRRVAFDSPATGLVPGDTNGFWDVFVHDVQNATTIRVSEALGGAWGDGDSSLASISADGRWVAFISRASNLVPGDTMQTWDSFVRDLQNGTTELVSVSSAGVQVSGCTVHGISGDGRFVALRAGSPDLVPGDTNGFPDVFVRDRQNGTTELVSLTNGGLQANGDSGWPSISGDGRFVAFWSAATNLVAGDTNGVVDIFLRDRQLGTTVRVNVSTGGAEANAQSGENFARMVSADGRFVVFTSRATNLVAGDTNNASDVFVRDVLNATTVRVSVDSLGLQGNQDSSMPAISADGRYVSFTSLAQNLVAADTNGVADIFAHDLLTGVTQRVSLATGGLQAIYGSDWSALSGDGRLVAFDSVSPNLVAGDTNGTADVFLRDQATWVAFCLGDGSAGACPCGNAGAAGRGCENSAASGGARLSGSGHPSLAVDTLVLTSSGELPHALSILLQSDAAIPGTGFGDGLRCVSGQLRRLYVRNASGGVVALPQAGDPSISARSAALGDVLAAGVTRYYQTYYRDPQPGFCPNPPGDNWNISSGLAVVWGQ